MAVGFCGVPNSLLVEIVLIFKGFLDFLVAFIIEFPQAAHELPINCPKDAY